MIGMLVPVRLSRRTECVAGHRSERLSSLCGLVPGHIRQAALDLARAVVEAGWDLNELRPAAMSLEEIFLQLTENESAAGEKVLAKESQQ